MNKKNAMSKIITHSIIAVVLTVLLIWFLRNEVSCGGRWSIAPFSCNFVSFGGYSYEDADKYSVGEFTLDEEITAIDIDWIAGQVNVIVTEEENVSAKETGADDEDEELRYRVVDGKLMIKFKKAEKFGLNDDLSKDLELYIPRDMAKKLSLVSVQCVSADLNMNDIMVDTVDIEMVSGKFESAYVTIDKFNFQGVSGNMTINGDLNELNAEMVSGKIKVNSVKMLSKIDVEAVSGDVTVTMPEGDGFTAEMESVSGDLNIEFAVSTKGDKKIYGDGSAEYSFESVSGDINLKKAE